MTCVRGERRGLRASRGRLRRRAAVRAGGAGGAAAAAGRARPHRQREAGLQGRQDLPVHTTRMHA